MKGGCPFVCTNISREVLNILGSAFSRRFIRGPWQISIYLENKSRL